MTHTTNNTYGEHAQSKLYVCRVENKHTHSVTCLCSSTCNINEDRDHAAGQQSENLKKKRYKTNTEITDDQGI